MSRFDTDRFSIFSDAFKDAYGFRPRGLLASRFVSLSDAAQDAAIAEVDAEVARQIELENRQEAEYAAHEAHEALVNAPTALAKALAADDSPDYPRPVVRHKATTRKVMGYDARVYMRCQCAGCSGRTWKRFRATQYRAVKVG